jgi:hypothetical protein
LNETQKAASCEKRSETKPRAGTPRKKSEDHLVERLFVKKLDYESTFDSLRYMNTANPHAQALGKLGRGRKKTMSPEAIRQRQAATKSRLAKAKKKDFPRSKRSK